MVQHRSGLHPLFQPYVFPSFISLQWLSNVPDTFVEIHLHPGKYTEVGFLAIFSPAILY